MENIFAKDKPLNATKVVVAMSGGVDSSVVATMLHRKGYKVIGVTLQLYDQAATLMKKGACCAGQDIYDARMVAEKEGFPHYVLDYESLFKQEVIDDFADSYLRGETPIPCIKCNQKVKFKDLYKFAKDWGADALATGHYVNKIYGQEGAELHKAADFAKDQSYFLYTTTKEQLDYIYFPLGSYTEEQTRKMAHEFGLSVSDKPDSQDICFVPNGDYVSVITKLRPGALDKGDIVHVDGKILGQHDGIINYTIGQRRGLGIAWHEPLYVIRLEADTHRVIVGPEHLLGRLEFRVKEVNWLSKNPATNIEIMVKTRSTHKGSLAAIFLEDSNIYRVEMLELERAVTKGQACVFYDGTRVLGGGTII